MNAGLQNGGYGYDLTNAQTWNPGAFGSGQSFNAFGATGRMKPTARGRSAIPNVSFERFLFCDDVHTDIL